MSLSLTILGTSTPYPLPDRPCSGYLVRAGESNLLVDLGPGSLANLQRHLRPDRLSAIWLSHLHADHMGDLPSLYYALAFADQRVPAPIPVYAPRGLPDRLAGFFARPDASVFGEYFDFREQHDGLAVEVGQLRLTSTAVEHGIEAYGLRAQYRASTLAYSGDCGPCPGLDALAAGADVLLCEADIDEWPQGSPQHHHTPADTGALAARAGVGTLIVTHVGPSLTRQEATRRAAAVFGGPSLTARENDTHLVGAAPPATGPAQSGQP